MLHNLDEQVTAFKRNKEGAEAALLATLRSISELYRQDFGMEAAVVAPLAQQFLTEADQYELSLKFEWREQAIGRDVVQRMEAFSSFAARA